MIYKGANTIMHDDKRYIHNMQNLPIIYDWQTDEKGEWAYLKTTNVMINNECIESVSNYIYPILKSLFDICSYFGIPVGNLSDNPNSYNGIALNYVEYKNVFKAKEDLN